jgi:hypothetical protein
MILGSLQYLKKSGNYKIKNYFSNSYEYITPNYNNYGRIISYKFRNINFLNFLEIKSFIEHINKNYFFISYKIKNIINN